MELPRFFDTNLNTVERSIEALALGAIFSAAYYLRFDRSFRWLYGVMYAAFSLVMLQWILPWALITVRDERWGTR